MVFGHRAGQYSDLLACLRFLPEALASIPDMLPINLNHIYLYVSCACSVSVPIILDRELCMKCVVYILEHCYADR